MTDAFSKHQRSLLVALVAMLCSASVCTATTFDVGVVRYTIIDSDALTVSAGKIDTSTTVGDIVIPSTVTNSDDGNTYTVTAITLMGFYNCTDLTSVTIPNTVTELKNMSFYLCSGLKTVTFEEGAESMTWNTYCFYGCTSLSSLNFPDGLTSTGSNAFRSCTSITSVTLPEGFTEIGQSCFNGCTALQKVSIPSTVETINKQAFVGCTAITDVYMHADSVPEVSDDADGDASLFSDETLSAATLHTTANAASLFAASGYWAFSNTSTDVETADDIADNDGLSGAATSADNEEEESEEEEEEDLSNVVLAVGDTVIVDDIYYIVSALDGYNGTLYVTSHTTATRLTGDIVIPGVFSYGNYTLMVTEIKAQTSKSGITSLTIPGTVSAIEEKAFYMSSNMTALTILDSDTALVLPASCFSNCYKLAGTVEIPGRVTEIEEGCFESDYNITGLTFNEGLETIGESAFQGLTSRSLTEITIPSTVTAVGVKAFYSCRYLTEINTYAVNVPETESGNSDGIFYSSAYDIFETAHLHVPEGSADAYAESEYWAFDNIIEGYVEPDEGPDTLQVGDVITVSEIMYVVETLEDSVGTLYVCDDNKPDGDVVIPETLTYSGAFEYQFTVDSLAIRAFSNATSLTGITLPGSIRGIGLYAFNGCSALTTVAFEDNDNAITLPNGCFTSCTSLSSLTLPSNLIGIGSNCFSKCTSLMEITLPEGLLTLEKQAFSGCTGLTSVSIPSTVVTLNGFNGCTSLTDVELTEGLDTIESYAFVDCTSLTSITLPEGLLSLSGFQGCTALKSISLPNTVTEITDYAFYGCTSLSTVELDDALTAIGEYAFGKTAIDEIQLPTALTSIGDYAFYGTSLAEIELSDNVATLGTGAFSGCTSLTKVDLCEALTSVGVMAFDNCDALAKVYAYTQNPPSTNNSSLDDASQDMVFTETTLANATLYVPKGAIDNYTSDEYWAFSNTREIFEYASIDPEPALSDDDVDTDNPIEMITTITITYDENVYVNGDTASVSASAYNPDNGTATGVLTRLADDEQAVVITFADTITTSGEWIITIPEGVIGNETAYNSGFESGGYNDELVLYYYLEENTDINVTNVTIDPAEGEVDTLAVFVLTFNDYADSEFGVERVYDKRNAPYIADADGNTVTNGTITNVYDEGYWHTSKITLADTITAAGEYTLVIPARTYYIGSNTVRNNNELTFSYTILENDSTSNGEEDTWNDSTDDGSAETDTIGEGISQIISAISNGSYDVYTISGQHVMTTSSSDAVANLPKGIYIVNRKKVIIK